MNPPEDDHGDLYDHGDLDDLEARLRRIAGEADPVPPEVVHAARLALSLRDLDAELAELVADTAVTGLTGVRGGQDDPRLLTWRSGELTVELQVSETVDGLELRGQVSDTAPPVEVGVEDEQGTRRALTLDRHGSFAVAGVAPGRLRLRVTDTSGRRIVTGWLTR